MLDDFLRHTLALAVFPVVEVAVVLRERQRAREVAVRNVGVQRIAVALELEGEPLELVHLLGWRHRGNERRVAGVAGVVREGILPGYLGYETGQAAVGDAFDWLRKLTGQPDFVALGREAAALPPGADGVRCMDWFNGCRTPLMDGGLKGAFTGLALHHRPAHLYRALLEASAFGVRWIVELLRDGGVPVRKFVATGGLPHHNPLVVQVYADVLGEPIAVHPSRQGPALGSAILGALAAGAFKSPADAIRAMAVRKEAAVFKPDRAHLTRYRALYREYRRLGDFLSVKR